MSTHNIGFNEDLTKIIFELSSNIIKYAPYFFCCEAAKAGLCLALLKTLKTGYLTMRLKSYLWSYYPYNIYQHG